jgi:thiamine-phosphate pyrophosphorylase
MTPDIRLYGILDPGATPEADLAILARLAAQGGATILQLRDKHSDGRVMIERARAILAALAGSGVPLVINDRVDVALASGAQGVHLGQSDIEPKDARAILGGQAIIGRSLTAEAHIRALTAEPCDYGAIGGVFPTRNKDDAGEPIGLEGLSRLMGFARSIGVTMPIGAIAGITEQNAAGVIGAGADGIAVIGALFAQPDPEAAAKRLRSIVDRATGERARAKARAS